MYYYRLEIAASICNNNKLLFWWNWDVIYLQFAILL